MPPMEISTRKILAHKGSPAHTHRSTRALTHWRSIVPDTKHDINLFCEKKDRPRRRHRRMRGDLSHTNVTPRIFASAFNQNASFSKRRKISGGNTRSCVLALPPARE
jgi:hypothetical protein